MAVDSIPVATAETRTTATSSGSAHTVVTIPDGSTYNVRLTAVNNTGSDSQKIYVSQDATNYTYKKLNDGEEIIIADVVLTASGSAKTFKVYGQASGFVINPLVFNITTI